MQLKILDRRANEIVIEVEGEGHTLCNLLEAVLLEDKDVEFASYDISHPLVAKPAITVRTKGNKSPEEALREAVNRILQMGRDLRKEFEEAFGTRSK